MKPKKVLRVTLIYVSVIIVVLFAIFPIYWMAASALKVPAQLLKDPPSLIPRRPSLINFVNLISRTQFLTFFGNSSYVCICAILATIILTVPGAYSLTRFRYRGREILATFSLVAYMVPPVLLVIPLYLIMVNMRLADKLAGLIIVYTMLSVPYSLWLLRGFFQTIPMELEEAAFIDGATRLQVISKVVMPLALPGIIAVSVFSLITVWNDYLFALILISSAEKMTVPIGLGSFVTEYEILWHYILAGSFVVAIPVFIFFLVVQKYLIKGWGTGGIKG